MRTIQAKIVRADGVRVRLLLSNTNMLAASYHVNQVYPGNRSYQLTVVRPEKARAPC